MRNAYTAKNSTMVMRSSTLLTDCETPSLTSRFTPSGLVAEGYTTHGWRPSSAVNQPHWMATSGNTGETSAKRCSHFMSLILPSRSVNTSTRITVRTIRPNMATMRWYVWNTAFTGAVSGSIAPYSSVSARSLRPWYSVSHSPVARKLVPPGMANGVMTSWLSSSTHPKAYSGGTSESYMPSIIASFVGCSSATVTADACAVTSMKHVVTMPTTAPIFIVFMAKSVWRFLMRYHADTAIATNAPMMSSATTVCE